eukprot:scaffold586790_cov39-Prasinocladus_malaysianus.AAC.1
MQGNTATLAWDSSNQQRQCMPPCTAITASSTICLLQSKRNEIINAPKYAKRPNERGDHRLRTNS